MKYQFLIMYKMYYEREDYNEREFEYLDRKFIQ